MQDAHESVSSQIHNGLALFLEQFWESKSSIKACCITGKSGIGKTMCVKNAIKEMNYKPIYYSAAFTTMTPVLIDLGKNLVSQKSVIDSLCISNYRRQVVIIDDIDILRTTDASAFNVLTQLVRKKRTEKQREKESVTSIPIICIGCGSSDKKSKELMKHTMNVRLNTELNNNSPGSTYDGVLENIIAEPLDYSRARSLAYKCDLNVLAMVWHENIVDLINPSYANYAKLLDLTCFCDTIDKAAFSNQIWELVELSSLLRVIGCGAVFHSKPQFRGQRTKSGFRFTRVLTKYSTLHNVKLFLNDLVTRLDTDVHELATAALCDEKGPQEDKLQLSGLELKRLIKYC